MREEGEVKGGGEGRMSREKRSGRVGEGRRGRRRR